MKCFLCKTRPARSRILRMKIWIVCDSCFKGMVRYSLTQEGKDVIKDLNARPDDVKKSKITQ